MDFGDYAPYLEVSVAINLLLAVWAALWRRVGSAVTQLRGRWFRAMKSVADNFGEAANLEPPVVLMERDDALDAMANGMPTVAKVTVAVVVTTIALALFFVPPDCPVGPAATILIGVSPLAQPVLMLLLVTFSFAGYAIFVWVRYRLFRRRAIKTIKRFPRTGMEKARAAGSPQLRLSDEGEVRDDSGQHLATICRVSEGMFFIFGLADVFDRDMDITHPTQDDAFRTLQASYHPH